MNELLKFMPAHLSFLWTGDRFRIEKGWGSEGNAIIYLISDVLRIELPRDRGQLLISLQSAFDRTRDGRPKSSWFSSDLVCRLIGESDCEELTVLQPDREAAFLRDNLDALEAVFARLQWEESRPLLRQFALERSRKLVGS